MTNFVILRNNNKDLTFLVDTGADISIFKENCQSNSCSYEINERAKCKLTGITSEEICSLGTINLKLNILNK